MELKFVNIDEILKTPSLYYAHQKEVEGNVESLETLEEHTLLCQQYFRHIYESKSIGEKISIFFQKYMGKCSKETRNIAEDMWCNVVTFHDIGKHNPNFQRDVLGRRNIERNATYFSAGSEHSALSAVIYIDYYYKKMQKVGKEEGMRLCALLIYNAYVISRHHSRLASLNDFLFNLREGKIRKLFKVLQQESASVCIEKFQLNEKVMNQMIHMTDEVIRNQTREQAIWLYFYEKLTYSMLVAADYYATSEFESGVQIQDLGEMDSISELLKVHQSTKVNQAIRQYEKDVYPENSKQLQKETKINVLRNEIFLDAEHQLLKEKEKNIFYLEAPTGSGKSNISMNLSFQLAMQDEHLKKIYYTLIRET